MILGCNGSYEPVCNNDNNLKGGHEFMVQVFNLLLKLFFMQRERGMTFLFSLNDSFLATCRYQLFDLFLTAIYSCYLVFAN
jgi:hypothetical protein